MTTTAMMKTKMAVIDPTMSGSCSCHDFGGSALGETMKTLLNLEPVSKTLYNLMLMLFLKLQNTNIFPIM